MGWPINADYAPATLLFPSSNHFDTSRPYASFDPEITVNLPPDPPSHPFARFSTVCRLGSSSSAPLYANPSRKRSRDDFTTTTTATTALDGREKHAYPAFVPRKPVPLSIIRQPFFTPSPTATFGALSAHIESGTENLNPEPAVVNSTEDDLRGRKLQRLDSAPSIPNVATDNTTATTSRPFACSTPPDTIAASPLSSSPSARSILEDPQVDDLTHLLGISWQRMSPDDAELGAAIRGWQKFINNRWSRHIRNSRIVLKHRGLNAFLVASEAPIPPTTDTTTIISGPEAFYLFNEDLSEARLVANDWETCVQRLRTAPITFAEGSQTFTAADCGPCQPHELPQAGNGVKEEFVDAGVARSSTKDCGWEDRGSIIAMDLD